MYVSDRAAWLYYTNVYFFGRALSGQPPSIHYKSFNLNTFISLSVNGLGLFVAELAASAISAGGGAFCSRPKEKL